MSDTDIRAPERISRLGIPDEGSLSPQIERLYADLESQGGVSNWIKAVAIHPVIMRRFLSYYEKIFSPTEAALSMTEREMIASVVSGINGCTYCTLHHTGGLAGQINDGQRAQRIAHNYREVNLTDRERAICDFAVKVTESADRMSDSDFQALRDVGLSDVEIFEVLEVAGFFCFSNRVATALAILPDSALFDFQRR